MVSNPGVSYSITFLLDPENNWLRPFVEEEWQSFDHKKCRFTLSTDHSNVANQDVVFILGYTKKLDKTFLNANKLNLVVHESALPKGKGFSPVQAQVLAGQSVIPLCLFEATEKLDSGDIFETGRFELTGYELFPEIREKQARATLSIISRFLVKFPKVKGTPQVGEETFFQKRSEADNELDIDRSIRDQFARLRLGNNKAWPSHFTIDNHKYLIKIYKASDD